MPKRISEKTIFEKGRFLLKDITIQLDSDKTVTYQMWDKPDTAMIVPITENGDCIFIREYHAALDSTIVALPKGRVESGDLALEAANKELQEEVGYGAGTLTHIATFSVIPGYISGLTHVYLAQNLIKSEKKGDEQWELPMFLHPLKEFEKLIDDKMLTEARMIAALYEVRRFLYNK
ncbi:MAG: NUDIX domain-containing protein [Candidatus Roizmanbacteria bacterium]|nr:NUDIX domain-containing protein [Candidatus Roizmanbacteria bacterium]